MAELPQQPKLKSYPCFPSAGAPKTTPSPKTRKADIYISTNYHKAVASYATHEAAVL